MAGGKPRVAVLGAGPIGLEAALYATTLGYPVTVLEAGRPGEYVRRWGHVRLFSPFGMNSTRLGREAIRAAWPQHDLPEPDAYLTGHEHVAAYLDPLANLPQLAPVLRCGARVVEVGRSGFLKGDAIGSMERAEQPFRILVETESGSEEIVEADVVLDCTGTYGQHRWAGDGGVPALGERELEGQIEYWLADVGNEDFSGQSVAVVGTGYSAATVIGQLGELVPQRRPAGVVWLARRERVPPVVRIPDDPLPQRDQVAATANRLACEDGSLVDFRPGWSIRAIHRVRERLVIEAGDRHGKTRHWTVDRIFAHVGYRPNTSIYRELQVHECYATQGPIRLAAALLGENNADCLKQTCPGPEVLSNPEPNFFVLGAKSYGRNSHFLLRVGFEQIQAVFTLISGREDLDLYRVAGAVANVG